MTIVYRFRHEQKLISLKCRTVLSRHKINIEQPVQRNESQAVFDSGEEMCKSPFTNPEELRSTH